VAARERGKSLAIASYLDKQLEDVDGILWLSVDAVTYFQVW